MKKSIRMVSLAIAAVMFTAGISGCGEKTENADITTITIWSGNSHAQGIVTEYMNNWNETVGKKNGIKIDYTVQGGDSLTKTIELALQNGTAPDIFEGGAMPKLAENGDIMAIEDIPGGEEFLKPYRDAGKLSEDRGMYKGKTYSVPTGACPQGMVYNKDMFKAAGIVDEKGEAKPPKTWSEIRQYAKILTDKSKNQYGIIAPIKWGGWFESDLNNPAMSLCGFIGYNPAKGKFDYSPLKTPMETWLGMKADGSIYPGADSLDNDSARAMFAEGSIGMKFAYYFDVGVLNDQFPAKCDWGVTTYPINEDGTGYKHRMDYGYVAYINANSKAQPEKLLEVIKVFAGDDFGKKMFEESVSMPYNTKIIETADYSKSKKGWAEFAKIADKSTLQPLTIETDWAGMESASDIFINYVWTGKMSVDEGIEKMTGNANKAIENYYSTHTEKTPDMYIIKDWTPVKL